MSSISKTSVLALAALNTALAGMEDDRARRGKAALDDLKQAYLSCERAATGGALGSADIMRCSVVYEELKARVFKGDFEQLLAWSRAQRRPDAAQTCQRED